MASKLLPSVLLLVAMLAVTVVMAAEARSSKLQRTALRQSLRTRR